MMSRPNLDEMFAQENVQDDPTLVYDDSVRAYSTEWTVKELRQSELRELQAQSAEYTDMTGTDMMGGYW
jgi:hypothetical protein